MRIILFILSLSLTQLFGQQFTRITTGPVVTDGGDSRSVNWIDYDNDNDLDLFITNGPSGGENNFFYENENGSFTKIENLAITQDNSPSDGSSWGDFNNDGYADLFVANWYGADNKLYLNTGNKTFNIVADTSSKNAGYSESASWADYNRDGFLDLFVANSSGNLNNFVYKNSTSEKFSRISGIAISDDGGASRHMDWADYDNDGYTDLFVANENNQKNFLYHNNGDSTFSKITTGDIVSDNAASFGSSWADYDNDGDLDLFVANWNNQKNALYKNKGDGSFEKINNGNITDDGGYSIGTAWADVDNDGDQDLFVTNGFASTGTNNFLYLNNGDGTFLKDSSSLSKDGGWSYGASFADYNRDGFLDLAIAKCFAANENNALFVNNGNSNKWIILKLKGTISNKSAIGAVVRIKASIGGENVWQMRQVSGQNGYCGQNLEIHFGLGDATQIDSIIVQWPSGQLLELENIPLNQVLEIEESVPTGFLRPHFKANKHIGFGKEQLKFNDLSVSAEDQPIISWQWDFNNDGISDSEMMNPEWQYDTLGTYSVKLSINNGSEEKSKVFKEYISIKRVPGIPIINSFFPTVLDTIILKRQQIQFYAQATDSSEYPITFSWYLNGVFTSNDTAYDYRASSFNIPRIDSVRLNISNGYNSVNVMWQINVVNEITALSEENVIPLKYQLFNNHPNPFNATTTISYSIAENSTVHISIFDISGKLLDRLDNTRQPAGHHKLSYNANHLASGIYYYKLTAGSFIDVKQMILIK